MKLIIIFNILILFCVQLKTQNIVSTFDDLMISNKVGLILAMNELNITQNDNYVIFIYQHEQDTLKNWAKYHSLLLKERGFLSLTFLIYQRNNKNFIKMVTDTAVFKEIVIEENELINFENLNIHQFSQNEIYHDFPVGIYDWYSGIIFNYNKQIKYFKYINEDKSEVNLYRKHIIDLYKHTISNYLKQFVVDYYYINE